MDYSSDWLLEIISEYKKLKNLEPLFISDWDVINNQAKYPTSVIELSLINSNKYAYKYLFSDEQFESKERIQYLFKSNSVNTNINNITITISATASLYLTLLSLHKRNLKNFLVFTPIYYSILDTLNDIKANITYFPLLDYNNFDVDLQKLSEVIIENQIEVIMFCDPIYSGGIEIPLEVFQFLSKISDKNGIWIICDYTLGGLEWNNGFFHQFSYTKINILFKSNNIIFIDSISKRLLINGIKISVIIGNPELISEIENYSSQVYGGFCSTQIEFLKEIYLPTNTNEVSFMIQNNVLLMKNNYEKLRSILMGTQYKLYPANSAYFTMIVHNELKSKDVEPKKIIKQFLYDENLLAFPSFHFSFNNENRFGFRVNVLRDLTSTIPILENCVRKNVK